MPEDPEWTLAAGDWRCTVSPLGASLRRLWTEGPDGGRRDILWGYSGTANKKGGQGDVLMPWPGRLRGGRYQFEGQTHQLPCNDKDGPNAIHGLLRGQLWEGEHDAGTARFRTRLRATEHAGYPFDVDFAVGYELLPTGLACAFVAHNLGSTKAPVGVGFHPYVATPDGMDHVNVKAGAEQVVEFEDLLPTGRLLDVSADLDFRRGRLVGDARLNHCFTGLQRDKAGFAHVQVGDVDVWMDRSFTSVVLYTGDALGPQARRALAVEPMTCATDAFNRPEWGLCVLPPGDAMLGTWGVRLLP